MKNCIAILLFAALVSGCTTVVSKNPVGLEPYSVSAELIEGTWVSDGEPIKIKIIDQVHGTIEIAWIEDKGARLRLETVTATLMSGKKGYYINSLELPDEDFGGYYIWAKIHVTDHTILIWPPLFESFLLACQSSELSAQVSQDSDGKITNIQLLDISEKIIKTIEDDDTYFDYKHPIVLMRLLRK